MSTEFRLSFQSLTFQKITRVLTAVDSQPMFDGGVLINVLGRLQVSVESNTQSMLAYTISQCHCEVADDFQNASEFEFLI